MAIYQLGNKTIEISLSPDGWRVRRYIWPAAHEQRDTAFPSEADAIGAVEKSAGRALRPIQPTPAPVELRPLPTLRTPALAVSPVPKARSLPPMKPTPARTPPVPPQARATPAAASTPAPTTPPAAPLRAGKLDGFRHMMGVIPDSEVAHLAGSSVRGVQKHRVKHGIFSPSGPDKPEQSAVPTSSKPRESTSAEPRRIPRAEIATPIVGRGSKLDAYAALVGVLEDAEVAAKAGLTRSGVQKYRVARGIPAASTQRAKDSLSTNPATVAPRISNALPPPDTTPSTPIKIPAVAESKPPTPTPTKLTPEKAPRVAEAEKPVPARTGRSKLDGYLDIVGVLLDQEVGRRAGVTDEAVRQFRVKRGIATPVRPTPAKPATPTVAEPAPLPVVTPPVAAPAFAKAPEPPIVTVVTPVLPAASRRGHRRSKVAAYKDLLGVLPDKLVAERAGVDEDAVRKFRTQRGIPGPGREEATTSASMTPAPSAKPVKPAGLRPRSSKLEAHRAIIGVLTDREVAARVGMSDDAVRKYRITHEIPAAPQTRTRAVAPVTKVPSTTVTAPRPKVAATSSPRPSRPSKATPAPSPATAAPVPPRPSKLHAHHGILGVLSDREVAARAGTSDSAVRRYRIRHGFAAAPPALSHPVVPPPAGQVPPKSVRAPQAEIAVPAATPASMHAEVTPEAVAVAEPTQHVGVATMDGAVASSPPVDPPVVQTAAPRPESEVAASAPAPTPTAQTTPEREPVDEPEGRFIAYTVIATRGEERQEYTVIGRRMSDAVLRAEAALARARGGPWEVEEMRARGPGLE